MARIETTIVEIPSTNLSRGDTPIDKMFNDSLSNLIRQLRESHLKVHSKVVGIDVGKKVIVFEEETREARSWREYYEWLENRRYIPHYPISGAHAVYGD